MSPKSPISNKDTHLGRDKTPDHRQIKHHKTAQQSVKDSSNMSVISRDVSGRGGLRRKKDNTA
jgi:hypothetical protein